LLNSADAVILCLPDEAAKEAVSLVSNPSTVIIDASTAYRTAEGWAYGFPELDKDQRGKIAASKRISNPGCYPTGAIALTRPLVSAGILPPELPVSYNAVSGYSGGGKAMIAEFEDESAANYTKVPFRIYGLSQAHKHVPEMQKHGGLLTRPFSPRPSDATCRACSSRCRCTSSRFTLRRRWAPSTRRCRTTMPASGLSRSPRSTKPRR